jgi:site-specific recombinase XerC
MTPLPPLLQGFFTERLARQRDASPHTIAAYRDSFRLLLAFLHEQTGKPPSKLKLEVSMPRGSRRSSAILSKTAATASGPGTRV